ncbi:MULTISPECIES: TatD family hydrolase [unclassified Prochlorococcus]|uniref:TatD family hydrolase n=1 Tax=unclassified Prochlorococcus TaxID=2627481 RepID=UPI0005337BAE|nr:MULTISPECIES: TatD family hydrolase [unclassified Prochlorococcus]KGG14751.1 putative deoxyribonuclease YcfH [Prochlorococcus sp. MIT 0602]KGG15818.1 putative deoxyribonuclease YcfH [Prochlorococcus sp. MIT 0603]
MNSLIDSHCHIVFSTFQDDLEEVASRWRAAGVKSLLHACVEPSEIPAIKALADRFPELRYSVGVHPLDTKHWKGDETIEVLRKSAREDSRVVAIGELGLDLYRDSNLEEQMAVLMPQLDLAFELNLPVIVHCRDAASPMFDLLTDLQDKGRAVSGVMHCWGGTVEEMQRFLDLGFYISFSGTVTFPKAKQIHECALNVPQDRFLIETDCPFLAPIPNRGKRNEPAYVQSVALKIADIRGQDFSDIAESSTLNARVLFGLP